MPKKETGAPEIKEDEIPDTLRSPISTKSPDSKQGEIQETSHLPRTTTRPIAELGPEDLAAITAGKVILTTDDDKKNIKSTVDTLKGVPRMDEEESADDADETPAENKEDTHPNRTGDTQQGVPTVEEVMEDDSEE